MPAVFFLSFLGITCYFLIVTKDPRNCHCLQGKNKKMGKKKKKKTPKRLPNSNSTVVSITQLVMNERYCDCQQLYYSGLGPPPRCLKLNRVCRKLSGPRWANGVVLKVRLQAVPPQVWVWVVEGKFRPRAPQFVPWAKGKRLGVLFCLSITTLSPW